METTYFYLDNKFNIKPMLTWKKRIKMRMYRLKTPIIEFIR